MILLFLTCTLLLTILMPTLSTWFYLIVVATLLPNPTPPPPFLLQHFVHLITYIPGAIIVLIFFKTSNFKSRLPQEIPGKYFMMLGLLLTILNYLAQLAPTLIADIHRGNYYLQLVRLISWPATLFLIVGLIKALLATSPNPSIKRDA